MNGQTNVGGSQVYYLGTGTSFDVSSIAGYKNFDASNFIVAYKNTSLTLKVDGNGSTAEGDGSASASLSINYDASTGKLTIGGVGVSKSIEYYGAEAWTNVSIGIGVYLVKGKVRTL